MPIITKRHGKNLNISPISEILAGKRELNRKHIEALSRRFKVDPGVFMSP